MLALCRGITAEFGHPLRLQMFDQMGAFYLATTSRIFFLNPGILEGGFFFVYFNFMTSSYKMLKKYDRSVLASEELHDFEIWLLDLISLSPILSSLQSSLYFPM